MSGPNIKTIVRGSLLALVVLFVLGPRAGWAQLEVFSEDEALLQGLLVQAESKFNSGLQAESIVDVRQVISLAQKFGTERDLTENEKGFLVRAYLLRARSFFNLGQVATARNDLKAALQLDPRLEVNPDEVSPRVIALLDEVKKEEVGTLFIDSEPGGAEVFLDKQRVGLTPLFATPAYRGVHEMEVRLQGYDPYIERITVLPDQQLQRNVSLTRVTGDVIIYTQPSGARVYLDEDLIGVTSGSPAPEDRGKFGAEYDFTELSGPLALQYVKPGVHTLRIEKECFETQVRNISVDTETREFDPFKMPQARANLIVESPVDGAKVYLNEDFLGATPVEIEVCAGESLLRVEKTGVGEYFQKINIIRDQRTEIQADLRPTLVFLGLAPYADQTLVDTVTSKLRASLGESKGFNLRVPTREEIQAALQEVGFTSLAELATNDIPDGRRDVVASQLQRLGEKLRCDLVLTGSFPTQRLQTIVNLYLYMSGHGYADVVPLEFQIPAKMERFFHSLDYNLQLSKSWVGMLTIDLLQESGCGVIRVSDGGPAQGAGIQPGDTILAVNDQPVANNKSFRDLIAASDKGRTLSVRAEVGGAQKTVEFSVDRTPLEIPKNNPDLLYNKILADLRLRINQASQDFDKNFALLNQALAYMHFKNWQSAVDTLNNIRFETKQGITNGTVYYYTGECMRALGYSADAITNYKKATSFTGATVESNDGESVTLLAEKRLRDLQ